MRAAGKVQARSTGEVRSWPWGMSCTSRRRGSGGARAGRLAGRRVHVCGIMGGRGPEGRMQAQDDEHNG